MTGAVVRAGVVRSGGVFLDGATCAVLWPIVRGFVQQRQRDGGSVKPEFAEALMVLRMAALDFHAARPVSADGPVERTFADIAGASSYGPAVVSTQGMADRLQVGVRQARRIADAAGVVPVARDAWAREDVNILVAQRSVRRNQR